MRSSVRVLAGVLFVVVVGRVRRRRRRRRPHRRPRDRRRRPGPRRRRPRRRTTSRPLRRVHRCRDGTRGATTESRTPTGSGNAHRTSQLASGDCTDVVTLHVRGDDRRRARVPRRVPAGSGHSAIRPARPVDGRRQRVSLSCASNRRTATTSTRGSRRTPVRSRLPTTGRAVRQGRRRDRRLRGSGRTGSSASTSSGTTRSRRPGPRRARSRSKFADASQRQSRMTLPNVASDASRS